VILPILLREAAAFHQSELDRTGFPVLDGIGKGSTSIQTSIHRYEKFFVAVGRGNQPRIYLLDSDRKGDEKNVLKGTCSPTTGRTVEVAFLPLLEIENYLLVSEAICKAVREELALAGKTPQVEESEIEQSLTNLLDGEDGKVFPQGKKVGLPADAQAKGSIVLERLYSDFGIQYNKRRSGALIARFISSSNQPHLAKLSEVVRNAFHGGES
jgi:hypothetical protein